MGLPESMLHFGLAAFGGIPQRADAAWQWARGSADFIAAGQESRLARMLAHAYAQVPYYREILGECGAVEPGGRVNLSRFASIPLLNRASVRERFAQLQPPRATVQKPRYIFTSGTTGEPARFVGDAEFRAEEAAANLFALRMAGRRLGERNIALMANQRGRTNAAPNAKDRLRFALIGRRFYDCYMMDAESMRRLAGDWNRWRPQHVWGYTNALYEFARFAEGEGIALFRPEATLTTAETVFPHIRTTLERVFGAPVTNAYITRDAGHIACSMPGREDAHTFDWKALVEVVDEAGQPIGPDEDGEIVVTSLTNFAMPLIRYRVGDRGAWLAPDAGSGFGLKRLTRLNGRVGAYFRRADGALIDSPSFASKLFDAPWIQRFQLIQNTATRLTANLVTQRHPTADEEQELVKGLRAPMGEATQVAIHYVGDIPPLPNGKRQYLWSEVTSREHETREK